MLSGLAANRVCSAFIRWLLGSVDSTDYTTLSAFVAVIGLASLAVMRQAMIGGPYLVWVLRRQS